MPLAVTFEHGLAADCRAAAGPCGTCAASTAQNSHHIDRFDQARELVCCCLVPRYGKHDGKYDDKYSKYGKYDKDSYSSDYDKYDSKYGKYDDK